MIDARFRPVNRALWPVALTRERRSRWAFKAGWEATLTLLDREIRALDGRDVVIQADFSEDDLRLDGWPRASARVPDFPGVIVSFGSRHGPLSYLTDEYTFWQHNVRAIALGLESLRAVDRYGVSKRGEQYKGWRAIGAGSDVGGFASVDEASRWLLQVGDPDGSLAASSTSGRDHHRKAYRAAARLLHPDVGGDPAEFKRLQEAKALLNL